MYLVIIRREDANPETGEVYSEPQWRVDPDSAHIFSEKANGWKGLEVKIAEINIIKG